MKILTTIVGATALIISSGCSLAPMTPSKAPTEIRSPLAQFYSAAPTPTPVQYVLQDRAEAPPKKSIESAYPMTRASVGHRLADDKSRPTWFNAGN